MYIHRGIQVELVGRGRKKGVFTLMSLNYGELNCMRKALGVPLHKSSSVKGTSSPEAPGVYTTRHDTNT